MRVVFLGTGAFAVPALEAVHAAGHEVGLVVSQPDRPQGRGLSIRPTPVKAAAERLGLRVFQPEKLRAEPEPVMAQNADVLVVVAYGQILREPVLTCARLGAVNVHASLLPKYRGAAPIQWAIARGESETGVTIMQLDRGMDTGPVLLQSRFDIGDEETTATLEPKLAQEGAALLIEALRGLSAGTLTGRPQDEAAATHAPLIKKSDGLIGFDLPAPEIVNRWRAFSPWPGVQFRHGGRSIRILAASAGEGDGSAEPGVILGLNREGLTVACAGGTSLHLARLQPESRGAVSAFDFAHGAKLRAGQALDPAARE